MSVIKNLRSLSKMEFYKNAIVLRRDLTSWMLRNFGTTRNKKSIQTVIKNIDESDKEIIENIFKKYNRNPNTAFQGEFPDWFVDFERDVILQLLHDLVGNITSANSIYAVHDFEFDMRRKFQNKAIISCYQLYQELQYIIESFDTDINKIIPMLESIEREVDLLKGWRQSDNAKRKKKDETELDKVIKAIEILKRFLSNIKEKIKLQ